jgi:microcompartment protein CcmK/EutM
MIAGITVFSPCRALQGGQLNAKGVAIDARGAGIIDTVLATIGVIG